MILENNKRGVSPVIGVILMVAVTIILSAIAGAFLLNFGGQESPPSNSWGVEQEPDPIPTELDGDEITVSFEHQSGENVEADDLDITASGFDVNEYNGEIEPDEGTISAGDSVSLTLEDNENEFDDIEDGDNVNLVWQSDDESYIQATLTINRE